MLSQNSLKSYHKMQIDQEHLKPAVIDTTQCDSDICFAPDLRDDQILLSDDYYDFLLEHPMIYQYSITTLQKMKKEDKMINPRKKKQNSTKRRRFHSEQLQKQLYYSIKSI